MITAKVTRGRPHRDGDRFRDGDGPNRRRGAHPGRRSLAKSRSCMPTLPAAEVKAGTVIAELDLPDLVAQLREAFQATAAAAATREVHSGANNPRSDELTSHELQLSWGFVHG